MSEIKILDLPELPVQDQDYTLIVKPDGTHVKIKLGDLPGRPQRVPTYAAMLALLNANVPQKFTVLDDEFQGIESVPYEWDGIELFVYGTLVEPQPVLV